MSLTRVLATANEDGMVSLTVEELMALVSNYVVSKPSKLSTDYPKAPEGWSGPFIGYYLWENADGRTLYSDFDEAVIASANHEDCLGITRTARGKYSLRKMKGDQPIPNSKGQVTSISWVIGDEHSRLLEHPILYE